MRGHIVVMPVHIKLKG